MATIEQFITGQKHLFTKHVRLSLTDEADIYIATMVKATNLPSYEDLGTAESGTLYLRNGVKTLLNDGTEITFQGAIGTALINDYVETGETRTYNGNEYKALSSFITSAYPVAGELWELVEQLEPEEPSEEENV